MHVVIREYTTQPNAVDEIARRVREGFVPLISKASGFVGYTLVGTGTDSLVTVSAFEDQAGADESVRLAAGWVKDNLAGLVDAPPRVTSGAATIRETKPGAQFGYGVMRRYAFAPGDVAEVTRLVREGLVPRITSAPGFTNYTVVDAGNGVVVSLSAFADRASAESSTQATLGWVKEHLARYHPQPPEMVGGPIKVREARAAAPTG